MRTLTRRLEKNTSVTPAQQTISGSSRHSVPPRPRTSSTHWLRNPPPEGMNWQASASSPRHSTAMPMTPRTSTGAALFLRAGVPRRPLTFLLVVFFLDAAFLAIFRPPVIP